MRFRRNDWFKQKNEIHKSYVEAIKRAQKSITIVAAYFLPGAHFRKLLKEASRRGVSIRILVAGKSDSFSVKLAEQYLYDFYLRQHIDVYEWKNSILHGKLILIDDTWASIGSYNLNFLSHYISVELNADILSPPFISVLSKHLDDITQNATSTYKLVPAFKRSLLKQIQMWFAYNFFRWMMTIFVSEKIKYKK